MTRTEAERERDQIFARHLRETIVCRQFSAEELAMTLRWDSRKLNRLIYGSSRAFLEDVAKVIVVISEYDKENYLGVAHNLLQGVREEVYGIPPTFRAIPHRKNFSSMQLYPFHCAPKNEQSPRVVFAKCLTDLWADLAGDSEAEERAKSAVIEELNDFFPLTRLKAGKRKLDGWELCMIANAISGAVGEKKHKKKRLGFQEIVGVFFSSLWANYLNQWLDLPPNILRESLLFPVGRLRRFR